MTETITWAEAANRIIKGKTVYTCTIRTQNCRGDIVAIRNIAFESEDGARHLRQEVTKYQNMGMKYNAEIKQKTPTHFDLIYTERQ